MGTTNLENRLQRLHETCDSANVTDSAQVHLFDLGLGFGFIFSGCGSFFIDHVCVLISIALVACFYHVCIDLRAIRESFVCEEVVIVALFLAKVVPEIIEEFVRVAGHCFDARVDNLVWIVACCRENINGKMNYKEKESC